MKKFGTVWLKIIGVGLLFIIFYKTIDNFSYVMSAFGRASKLLTPFFIGIIIAFFACPPSLKIENLCLESNNNFLKKNARAIGIFIIYLLFFGIIGLLGKFILPLLAENASELAEQLPDYFVKITEFLKKYKFVNIEKVNEFVNGSFFHPNAMNNYMNLITGFANSLFSLFMGVIISVYMLFERESLIEISKSFFKKIFRSKYEVAARYGHDFADIFHAYFTGLALDSIVVGIISLPFYYLFRAPYPLVFAVITAIANMIPFFGPMVASVIIYIFSAVTLGPLYSLWILLFQIVLGQLDGNFIQPKIIGKSVGISPFWVIFAVLVFGGLWGFVGMIIGVPIIAAIKGGMKKT